MLLFCDDLNTKPVEYAEALERLCQLDVLEPSCRWNLHMGEVPLENYDATLIARKLWNEIMKEQSEWEMAMGY